MSKKISIITPYYKGDRFMPQLAGVANANFENLKKTFPDSALELIIVNDSPDVAVPEIIVSDNKLATTQAIFFDSNSAIIPADDQNLKLQEGITYKLITQSENGGIHKARIAGLRAASGDYIQFLDQDDVLTENALSDQLSKIGDNDVIVANAFMEQSDGSTPLLYKNAKAAQKSVIPDCFVKSHNQIASPGQCLIKKDSIPKEWSEYITKSNGSDDLFLWILMFYSGKKFVINSETLYVHKYTGENLSESEDKMTVSSLEVAGFLNEIDYCPKKMVEDFTASRNLMFGDNASGLNKAKSLAKNLDIVAFRAKWKIKEKL